MAPPIPTGILRLIHIDNLAVLIKRGGMHSPNATPKDGLNYKPIHNLSVQASRTRHPIMCGRGGTVHDYVPFYFGYLSPMLLQLKTGQVEGYHEGQDPLIYLCSTAQAVQNADLDYVFSDGHGIASYTTYFDDLQQLSAVDWSVVYERYWKDTDDDGDKQRRKQAEFLVYNFFPWTLIDKIAVIDEVTQEQVLNILAAFKNIYCPPVVIERGWYYY